MLKLCGIFVIGLAMLVSCANRQEGDAFILSMEGRWKTIRGDDPAYSEPGYNDGKWDTVTLPSGNLIPGKTALPFVAAPAASETKGFMWHRKRVVIHGAPPAPLLFQVREIVNADEVYFNGHLIGKTGGFPPRFVSGWCNFRSYQIPEEYLRDGENVIAIRMYYDAEAWITGPMRIIDLEHGGTEKAFYDFMLINLPQGISFLLVGIALLFALIYIQRREEIVNLYFALSCFTAATAMSLQYVENLYRDGPFTSNGIMRISQASLLLFVVFFAIMYRSYSDHRVSVRRLVLYLSLPVAGSLLMLFSHGRWEIMAWRNLFLATSLLYVADLFAVSAINIAHRNRNGIRILFGLIPTVLLGIHDVLAFSFGIFDSRIALYSYGLPVLLIAISLLLSRRFIESLHDAERLNIALTDSLEERVRLASIEKEIDIAKKIHLSALSVEVPALQKFRVCVKFVPSAEIGGDFYNFHVIDDSRMSVLLSDVTGHGLPAALIASMVKMLNIILIPVMDNPAKVLEEMNRIFTSHIKNTVLTSTCLYLDGAGGVFRFARAGHLPLLVHRASGVLEEYCPAGRSIGLSEHSCIVPVEEGIGPGDRIILCTDCITEAFNGIGEMYGEGRFKRFITDHASFSAEEFADTVYDDLRQWTGQGYRFEDDFTLIVIDVQ